MSAPTNRSATSGRHRRPRGGSPAPCTVEELGATAADRAERRRSARPVRAAGAGAGLAIAGVVLSAFAPAAAQAAPGLSPQQEDRLRTAEREYRAGVNGDDDLSTAEKECMREASWARVRAMETPAETAKKRARQDQACRLVSLPAGGTTADPLPPSFPLPGEEGSLFKSGAQRSNERLLELAEKLDDQWHVDQQRIDPGYQPPIFDLGPAVDSSNPFT